jgi:hypothetical protein
MTDPMLPAGNEQAIRELAIKRVKDRRDFQTHVVAYLVVNAFLWGIWAWTLGPTGYPWPLWVTLGWGIGVVLNWWDVTRRPITPEDVEREIHRMQPH